MKRIIFLSLIVFLLVVIVNLSLSLFALWSKKDVLLQTQARLAKEQREQIQLKQQLKQVSEPSFIEQQARDKLFLAKPGESIVFFPPATPSSVLKPVAIEKPAWQQWWELFF